MTEHGNFEGSSILNRIGSESSIGGDADIASARAALLAERDNRVRPGLDDKVLTSWNALAVSGLATAARALDEPRYGVLATGALDALARTVWRDGRLHATRRGEEGALPAYLDDHAFLLEALVAAMRTRFRRADFDWAIALADALCDRFEDDGGGFWFTAHDHEALFHRTMPGHDNATPSGNGVAARALIALGHLAGEPRYLLAAERAVRRFAPSIGREPGGYSTPCAPPPISSILPRSSCSRTDPIRRRARRPGGGRVNSRAATTRMRSCSRRTPPTHRVRSSRARRRPRACARGSAAR